MESPSPLVNPDDARAALDDAAQASSRMARSLRPPSFFHASIGAAIAVQVATTAWALSADDSGSGLVLVAGLAVFLVVSAVQLVRFRRLNGAWVGGLVSRAVLGTAPLSSVVYAAGLALATWAGLTGLTWLMLAVALLTGVAYAAAGRRWWVAYQSDPTRLARAESAVEMAVLVVFAVVALGLLVGYR